MPEALVLKTVRPGPIEAWIDEVHSLEPDLDVRVWPQFGNPADIAYALICKGPDSEKWPGRDLAALPNLRFLASVNAGVEYLLHDPQMPRTLPIVHTGSPLGDPMMTETVLMHVFRHHRRSHEYAEQQRAQKWQRLSELSPSLVTVGFMGFGAIARPAASPLLQLGFKVSAWTRRPRQEPNIQTFFGDDQLHEFLKATDILVMLLPITKETENIINGDTLKIMRKGSSIINLARGHHVDEDALLAALDSGHISAATLDVFRSEPLPQQNRFWSHPRVTVTPHSARRVTPQSIIPQLIENIRRVRRGQPLAYLVDPAAGY